MKKSIYLKKSLLIGMFILEVIRTNIAFIFASFMREHVPHQLLLGFECLLAQFTNDMRC